MKRNRGFTLIELLVVISIISLMSSVIFASLNTARIKARDAKRVTDLRQVSIAVELYYNDYGHYPDTGGAWSCFDCAAYIGTPVVNPGAASIALALAPYMKGTPTDPRNLGGDSGYLYTSSAGGANYKVMAWVTPENMSNFSTTVVDRYRCGTVSGSGCTNPLIVAAWTPQNTIGFWSPGGVGF